MGFIITISLSTFVKRRLSVIVFIMSSGPFVCDQRQGSRDQRDMNYSASACVRAGVKAGSLLSASQTIKQGLIIAYILF